MGSSSPMRSPLEDSLTIPETLDFNLKHNADQPLYVFSKSPQEEIITVKHLEFARACDRLAHAIRPGRHGIDGEIIAMIMQTDTITYYATLVGLMKAGFVPFPMNPRISPLAVVHLLKKTSCHRIITTSDTLKPLIDGIKLELSGAEDQFELRFDEVPTTQKLYPKLGNETQGDPFEPYPLPKERPVLGDLALYLHSSGTTGVPKAIPHTKLALLEWISFGMVDLSRITPRIRMGVMGLPSFHTLGIYAQLLTPMYGVVCVSVYPPTVFSSKDQPIMPTPDNILDHLKRTQSTALTTLPAYLQIWAGSAEVVDYLKDFAFIGFSGGPVAERLGDTMADAGVNLNNIYGGTEFGAPTRPEIERGHEKDWKWIKFSPKATFRWVDEGNGKYECQVLTTDTHHPSVLNMDDPKGYATSDLFEKHPTKPNLWKVVGRKDDVIVHSSGEKTVPAPMEQIICSSPLVKDVVMFGRGHDQAGVLVEMEPHYKVDLTSESELASLRDKLWPYVEEANHGAPAFSRIFKEMIIIASPEKPLPRSPKGSITRKAALLKYNEEIEELYRTVASAAGQDITPPDNWDTTTVKQWIIDQINDILPKGLASTSKDLFEQGFDSLYATFLRLRLITALRSFKSGAVTSISQDFVYFYPTVEALTDALVNIAVGKGDPLKEAGGHKGIEEMIERYSRGLVASNSESRPARTITAEVVLLTGSTGSLGAEVLSGLLQEKTVQRIYALYRPSSTSQTIAIRHAEKFKDKGLDPGLLDSKKLQFIEASLDEENLGLDQSTYEELRKSVTLIIHAAWKLDFNLGLASFESNVRGTRKLIDLARSGSHASSVRFIFTSSISSAQSWDRQRGPYPEEIVSDASVAVGTGYGEGKYVAERILAQSGLEICSLRIEQVSGGSPTGAWGTSDWVPILVKSSLSLKAFPDTPVVVSWVPMDAVSQAVLDVALTKKYLPMALNFAHPRPISWTSLIEMISGAISKELGTDTHAFPLIPIVDWVARLEVRARSASSGDIKKIPAIKLLDFFQKVSRATNNQGNMGIGGTPMFQTEKAREISSALRDLEQISAGDADRWIKYWNDAGFFEWQV